MARRYDNWIDLEAIGDVEVEAMNKHLRDLLDAFFRDHPGVQGILLNQLLPSPEHTRFARYVIGEHLNQAYDLRRTTNGWLVERRET